MRHSCLIFVFSLFSKIAYDCNAMWQLNERSVVIPSFQHQNDHMYHQEGLTNHSVILTLGLKFNNQQMPEWMCFIMMHYQC